MRESGVDAEKRPMTLNQTASAKYLGVSLSTLRKYVASGTIPTIQPRDGALRIAVEVLDEFVRGAGRRHPNE